MPYALRLVNGVLYAGFADGHIEANGEPVPLEGDALTRIVALIGPLATDRHSDMSR